MLFPKGAGFNVNDSSRQLSRRRRSFLALAIALTAAQTAVAADLFLDVVARTEVTPGVQYGTGATENGPMELLLDLHTPDGGPSVEARPAFVFVHGGGFVSGHRSEGANWARHFASRGYVAVSISYRLEGDRPVEETFFDTPEMVAELKRLSAANIIWPPGHFTNQSNGAANVASILRAGAAAARDTAMAVAWVRTNASELGVDPEHIVVGGVSAGAIASLFSSYLIAREDENAQVAGVLDICGSMYGNEAIVDANGPPLMIAHGDADVVVPYSFGERLRAQAQSAGLAHELITVPGGGHCPGINQNVAGQRVSDSVTEFFYRELVLSELATVTGFHRGDCNDDREVNVADAACTLNWLFGGTTEPGCLATLNTNGDAEVNIADPVALLNFLFGGGPPPVAPFPNCGPGASEEDATLGCANPLSCQ